MTTESFSLVPDSEISKISKNTIGLFIIISQLKLVGPVLGFEPL
jgi:hypothetical protein